MTLLDYILVVGFLVGMAVAGLWISRLIKDSDDFSHGLNERTQLSNIVPGVAYWKVLIRRLSS